MSVKKRTAIFIFKRKQLPSHYFQKVNKFVNVLTVPKWGIMLWDLLPVKHCHMNVLIYLFYKDDFI